MEAYTGQIELFPYEFVPSGWALCNGASLSASQYSALFNLIGYNFGGSGSSFNIPNLQGTEPIPGLNYCICLFGDYYPTQA